MAWHGTAIAGLRWQGSSRHLRRETAPRDGKGSVPLSRQGSAVGYLTWQAVNRINLIALAGQGGCMKETFWLCCQYLIPNDYHVPLNWCWMEHVRGLATTLPKIVSAIWSWQTPAWEKTSFPAKASQNFTLQACYLSCSWAVPFFIRAPVVKALLCIIRHWIILKATAACCWWRLFPLQDGYLH